MDGSGGRVENPKNLVQSVTKACAVLKAVAPGRSEWAVAEVAALVGHDRGTAFRLIHTLVDLGYLRAVPEGRRFQLTLKCLELGYAALSTGDLPTHALPLLRELVPGVADAGSLGVPVPGVSLTIGGGRLALPEFIAGTAPPACALAEELGTALRPSLGAIGAGGTTR